MVRMTKNDEVSGTCSTQGNKKYIQKFNWKTSCEGPHYRKFIHITAKLPPVCPTPFLPNGTSQKNGKTKNLPLGETTFGKLLIFFILKIRHSGVQKT
jgi:hypothetical protein